MGNYEKLKTLIPLELLEAEAIKQIENNLKVPFLKKLVILPDCHSGYDLPVGAAALLDGYVSPSYVGVDIGCGMCTVKTPIVADELKEKDKEHIFKQVYQKIPVGFKRRKTPLPYKKFYSASGDKKLEKEANKIINISLGTLGGGNHFIEFGKSEKNGYLYITIHSGSRHLGKLIADFYIKRGRFLAIDSKDGLNYWEDMTFAIEYALANRKFMMDIILKEILKLSRTEYEETIKTFVNESHNFAEKTKEGILHRKGATSAYKGQIGIIPANMRDGVYLTEGLGNWEYLSSASHGAGRKMSRHQARKKISQQEFEQSMKGIVARTSKKIIDEAPMAYKDIDLVLKYQKGKVIKVIDKLYPVINIKG
jgi:tRNA-splicing ligase RtcB